MGASWLQTLMMVFLPQSHYIFGLQFLHMLRNALILLILVLLALGIADARMPQVGDQVYIETSSSNPNFNGYQGEITDIGNGLICLRSSSHSVSPRDICIGVGSIVSLTWV